MRPETPTKAELHQECDQLKAENAELRQQLADVTESIGRVDERCAKLRAERDEWHRVAESKQDIIDHMRDERAENAKLRSELESVGTAAYLYGRGDLKAENAKLRELLSEVAKPLTNPTGGCLKPGCALGCPHHLECDEELGTCFYVDRMHELGIEVKA